MMIMMREKGTMMIMMMMRERDSQFLCLFEVAELFDEVIRLLQLALIKHFEECKSCRCLKQN